MKFAFFHRKTYVDKNLYTFIYILYTVLPSDYMEYLRLNSTLSLFVQPIISFKPFHISFRFIYIRFIELGIIDVHRLIWNLLFLHLHFWFRLNAFSFRLIFNWNHISLIILLDYSFIVKAWAQLSIAFLLII